MEIQTVKIEKPEAINFILGQSHFIKTVEDIHEALVSSVPGIKFGDLRTPQGAAQMIDRLLGRMKPGQDVGKGQVMTDDQEEKR